MSSERESLFDHGRKMESEVRVAVMAALELALDTAYHDGNPRDLAVASEAYRLAGYYDEAATSISHAMRDEIEAAIANARYGRNRRILNADARGMLAAFTMLAHAGVVTWASCSEAKRQRWLDRGGYEGDYRSAFSRVRGSAVHA